MKVGNRTRYSVHQHRNHLLAMAGTVPEGAISRDQLVGPQAYVEDVVGLINHSGYSAGRCRIFKGKLNRDGYGRVKQTEGNPQQLSHRQAFEQHHKRPVPTDEHLNHLCDRPFCVNPWHLYSGRPEENSRDAQIGRHSSGGAVLAGHQLNPPMTWCELGARMNRAFDAANHPVLDPIPGTAPMGDPSRNWTHDCFYEKGHGDTLLCRICYKAPPGNKFLESGCFDRLLGGRCMHCGDTSGDRPMDCGRCLASVENGWLTGLYTLIQQGKAMVSPLCTPFRDPYCFEHQTSLTEATFKGLVPYWYCEACQAMSGDNDPSVAPSKCH